MNSLPKNVTGQRRDCHLNPHPSASESSTLTTRLPPAYSTRHNRLACQVTAFSHLHMSNRSGSNSRAIFSPLGIQQYTQDDSDVA